jgi:hypothetical protein
MTTNQIETDRSHWADISIEPYRLSGQEFTLRGTDIGHVHPCRVIDIPFTEQTHDILIGQGITKKNHVYPESGWVFAYIYYIFNIQHYADADEKLAAVDVNVKLAEVEVSDALHDVSSEVRGAA